MSFTYNGKIYRSYKHPILEYIFKEKTKLQSDFPDEILFTYEDLRQAMRALSMNRDTQASLSNFTIDLTRRAATHEARVSAWLWDMGYDLDRASDRDARKGVAGRLIRKELKAEEPWIVWPQITDSDTIRVPNQLPEVIKPYLGKDEGALLSVMDYCDVLSLALHGQGGVIKRVQHPKKWQPGEVDGLYAMNDNDTTILYPVEAKALSTGDHVNLAQIQGMYKTIRAKITDVMIVPIAVQMLAEGMYMATFEAINESTNELIISRYLKVEINPSVEAWQKKMGKSK